MPGIFLSNYKFIRFQIKKKQKTKKKQDKAKLNVLMIFDLKRLLQDLKLSQH